MEPVRGRLLADSGAHFTSSLSPAALGSIVHLISSDWPQGQDVHESTGVASSFLADIPISRQRNPSQSKRPQGTLSKPSSFPERGPPPSTLKTTTSPQRVDTCAAKL
ncbi:hypothetical protein QC762_0080580 [Podospora pseudocomata]|uniref:Uncharacterized protein n=1 Tax=Podospora pseudocomata TaxID=2093779 RepID=A0ABR0GBL4_9PEZI|nr:hypothetical protein QC762_0080580 [Podospora pseudocomata]